MEATTWSKEKQEYSLSEFMEYMSSNLLDLPSDQPRHYYVFCSQESDSRLLPAAPETTSSSSTTLLGSVSIDQAGIRERMKQCLQNILPSDFNWDSLLIQFWEPRIINGRRFLTTSQQPFAIKRLYRGLSWYRKLCTNHDVLVEEGADKDGLGPVGRVFLNGQPESSPNLRFYSIKEFPLRDQACGCGLRKHMALPIFEQQSNCCAGVLELVSFLSPELPTVYFTLSHDALKESNLKLLHTDGQSVTQTVGSELVKSEIQQMFSVVNETPNIPLAMAWIPCQGCSGNCSCMELHFYAWDLDWQMQYDLLDSDFLQACSIHKLQQGKGVAGRALRSAHKLCFCRSIYGFKITEYPLAHYVRKAMLTVSFAICLQSVHTGPDPYVLEFFMRPGNQDDGGDPRSLIQSLLMKMRHQLLSFKVASGQKLGDELLVEILRFPMDDEPVYFQKSPSDGYPLGFKLSALESPAEVEHISPSQPHPPLQNAGRDFLWSTQAGSASAIRGAEETTEVTKRKRRGRSSKISLRDIESQSGMPQKEAAETFGVSLSTLKRTCRKQGIQNWPDIRDRANPSLLEVMGQDAESSRAILSCSNPSTGSITKQDTKLVTVKANYESTTNIRFQLCTSSGIAELQEKVACRLNLRTGDFDITYEDKEGDSILLNCDDDLRYYVNELTTSGLTTIQMYVKRRQS